MVSKEVNKENWSVELKELGPGIWGREVPPEERRIDPEFVRKLAQMSHSKEYKRMLKELLVAIEG